MTQTAASSIRFPRDCNSPRRPWIACAALPRWNWPETMNSKGWSEISRTARTPHLSRSKADLAIAACEMCWQESQPELDRIFTPQIPPLERLSRWCDYIQQTQREKARKYGHVCGYPHANVGAELAARDEKVRIKVE